MHRSTRTPKLPKNVFFWNVRCFDIPQTILIFSSCFFCCGAGKYSWPLKIIFFIPSPSPKNVEHKQPLFRKFCGVFFCGSWKCCFQSKKNQLNSQNVPLPQFCDFFVDIRVIFSLDTTKWTNAPPILRGFLLIFAWYCPRIPQNRPTRPQFLTSFPGRTVRVLREFHVGYAPTKCVSSIWNSGSGPNSWSPRLQIIRICPEVGAVSWRKPRVCWPKNSIILGEDFDLLLHCSENSRVAERNEPWGEWSKATSEVLEFCIVFNILFYCTSLLFDVFDQIVNEQFSVVFNWSIISSG